VVAIGSKKINQQVITNSLVVEMTVGVEENPQTSHADSLMVVMPGAVKENRPTSQY
jgi:hypothetical protein